MQVQLGFNNKGNVSIAPRSAGGVTTSNNRRILRAGRLCVGQLNLGLRLRFERVIKKR